MAAPAPAGTELTPGAIARLHAGILPSQGFQPVLAVKAVRTIGSTASQGLGNRYKVTLFDREYYFSALVTSQPGAYPGAPTDPNDLFAQIEASRLAPNTFVRLLGWTTVDHAGKPLLFVTHAQALGLGPQNTLQQFGQNPWKAGGAPAPPGAPPGSMPPPSTAPFGGAAPSARDEFADTQPASAAGLGFGRFGLGASSGAPSAARVPPGASAAGAAGFGGGFGAGAAHSGLTPQRTAAAPVALPLGGEATPPPVQRQPSTPFDWDVNCRGPGGTNPYGGVGNNPYGGVAPAAPAGALVAAAPAGFGAAAPASATQQARQPPGGGRQATLGFGGAASGAPVVLVASLSPYSAGRWRIKARVTLKGDVRKFNNARGEGQLMKVDLQDHSGEIQTTFFGRAVDAHGARIQQGKVYFFSKGSVKNANPKWDRGEFVLTFDEHAIIEEAEEEASIPGVRYTFMPIAQILEQPDGQLVDLAGILSDVQEPINVTMRSGAMQGQEKPKRDLVLWDPSGGTAGAFIELTLWGEKALAEYELDSVMFVRCARVRIWKDRICLSNFNSTAIDLNPDHPHSVQLTRQWGECGKPQRGVALGPGGGGARATAGRLSIEAARQEDLNLAPPPVPGQDFAPGGPSVFHRHTIVGTVIEAQWDRPPFYPACPESVERAGGQPGSSRTCNKKLSQDDGSDGLWRCAAGHACQQPAYRYMCRLQVADATGALDASAFDECGPKLFGCQATDLAAMWEDPGREEEKNARVRNAVFKRVVAKFRSSREIWNEEERIRYVLNDLSDVPDAADAKIMLADVRATLGQA